MAGSWTRFQVFAALAGSSWAAEAPAQPPTHPPVISPLRIATDRNGVNLNSGRMTIDGPALSVPAAPNLRFDRVQNAAPYAAGRVLGGAGDVPSGNWSVHTGAGASESFSCIDTQDCSSVTGTGSSFRPPITMQGTNGVYRQAGTGTVWDFNLPSISSGTTRQSYASLVRYANGETIEHSYQMVQSGPFNQKFYRPTRLASNLGYHIALTYQGDEFGTIAWGTVAQATLYRSSEPDVPLARLTYSGNMVTDLGGRQFLCSGCGGTLGSDVETPEGSLQLPGEDMPTLVVTAHPDAPVVASVTRDGVAWTYAYLDLRQWPATGAWVYDQVTVAGPNGYNQVYRMAPARTHSVMTGATDSIGRSSAFQLDPVSQRPVRVTEPEGNAASVHYDEAGNVVSRTLHPGPGPGPAPADIVETANYTVPAIANLCGIACWRPNWRRDALGRQTDYAFSSGLLVEQTDPADADGVRRRTRISYATTAQGVSRPVATIVCGIGTTCGTSQEIRTEYDYSGDTLLVAVERRLDPAGGAAIERRHSYDPAGRLLSTDGPLPGTDDAVYNRYDVHGRRTWEIGARAPNGLRIATRTHYRDSDDKAVAVERGTLPSETSDALTVLSRTDIAYDARRNPERETVSANGTAHSLVQRRFDQSGRLECEAARMNPAAFASPEPDACLPGAQGQGAGAFGPDRIVRTVYDAAGQRLQQRSGVGTADEAAEASWAYNLNGQIVVVVDGNGNRAELRYDRHMRQDRWTFPAATGPPDFHDAPDQALASAGAVNPLDYEEYGHDAAGNRTSLRKRDGSVIGYAYDDLDRMILKTVPERPGLSAMFTRDVHYGYDLRNLPLYARFDSPTGEGVTNAYDGFGRLVSSTTAMSGVSRTLAYQWDAAGNRTRITHPDGAVFSTSYDALGRPEWLTDPAESALAGFAYAPSGLPSGVGRPGATSGLQFDPIGRLTSLSHYLGPVPTLDVHWAFARNPAGQIASVTRDNDAYAWTGHHPLALAYAANGLNQYTATVPPAQPGATFAYDANGSLVSEPRPGGARQLYYDVENRLIWASGSPTAAIVYDPLGRLHHLVGGSAVTTFLYDGDALVAEYDGAGTMTARYVHGVGADVPLVEYRGVGTGTAAAERRNLLADHQGSIVAVSSNAGARLSINAYDEYGKPAATNSGRFQYTGQIWLAELGLYHYKARVYSPELGRFLQVDPVGYDDQFNLYAYVGNDPVNLVDPTGTQIMYEEIEAMREVGVTAEQANRAIQISVGVGLAPIAVVAGGEAAAVSLARLGWSLATRGVTMPNTFIRGWYLATIRGIPNAARAAGGSLRQMAQRAFRMRVQVRDAARNMMSRADRAALPTRTESFAEKVAELMGRGLTRDQAYREIVESAARDSPRYSDAISRIISRLIGSEIRTGTRVR